MRVFGKMHLQNNWLVCTHFEELAPPSGKSWIRPLLPDQILWDTFNEPMRHLIRNTSMSSVVKVKI